MIEYYSEYNGRCIVPETSPAREGTRIVLQKSCQGEEFLFCYGYDERIYHAQSNLCLVKVGILKNLSAKVSSISLHTIIRSHFHLCHFK